MKDDEKDKTSELLQGLYDGHLEVLERLACLSERFLKGFQESLRGFQAS